MERPGRPVQAAPQQHALEPFVGDAVVFAVKLAESFQVVEVAIPAGEMPPGFRPRKKGNYFFGRGLMQRPCGAGSALLSLTVNVTAGEEAKDPRSTVSSFLIQPKMFLGECMPGTRLQILFKSERLLLG
jgi:hypothetical protein